MGKKEDIKNINDTNDNELNFESLISKISTICKNEILSKTDLINLYNYNENSILSKFLNESGVFQLSQIKESEKTLINQFKKLNLEEKNELLKQTSKLLNNVEIKKDEIDNLTLGNLEKRFSYYLVNILNEHSYLNRANKEKINFKSSYANDRAFKETKKFLLQLSDLKKKANEINAIINTIRLLHEKLFEKILLAKNTNNEFQYFELLNVVTNFYEFLKNKNIINISHGIVIETLSSFINKLLMFKIKMLIYKDDVRASEIRFEILEAWRFEILNTKKINLKNSPFFYFYISSFFGTSELKNFMILYEKNKNNFPDKKQGKFNFKTFRTNFSYKYLDNLFDEILKDFFKDLDKNLAQSILTEFIINSIDHLETTSQDLKSEEDYFVDEGQYGIIHIIEKLHKFNSTVFENALIEISSNFEEKALEKALNNNFLLTFSKIKNRVENEFEQIHKSIKTMVNHKTSIEIYDLKLTKEIIDNKYFNMVLKNDGSFTNSHEKKFFADFESIIEPLSNKTIKSSLQQEAIFLNVISKIKDLEKKIFFEPTYIYFYYVIQYLDLLQTNLNKELKRIKQKKSIDLRVDLDLKNTKSQNELILNVSIKKEGNLVASEVKLEFEQNNYFTIEQFQEGSITIGTIDDQNTKIIPLNIKLNSMTDEIINLENFEIKGKLYYSTNISEFSLDSKSFEYFAFKNQDKFDMVKRIADNPYTQLKGTVVHKRDYLFGREGIMKELNSILFENDNKEAFKAGNLIALHGQTRAGKSSILKYFEETVAETGYVSIVHIQSIDSLYRQEGDDDKKKKAFRELCRRMIEKVKSTLSRSEDQEFLKYHKNLNLNNKYYAKPDILLDTKKTTIDPTEAFQTFVDDINYYSNNRFRLLLIIDEFTLLKMGVEKKKIYKGFLNDISDLTRGPSISIIFSGHEHTEDIIKNPEYIVKAKSNPIEYKEVGYFDIKSTTDLVTMPLIKNGIDVLQNSKDKDAIINRMFDETAGSPYLINLIMYRLVEFFNKKIKYESKYFTIDDLDKVLEKIVTDKAYETKINEYFEKIIADEYYQVVETSQSVVKSDLFGKAINLKEFPNQKSFFDTYQINSTVIKRAQQSELSLDETSKKYIETYEKYAIDYKKVLLVLQKRNIIDSQNRFVIKLFDKIMRQKHENNIKQKEC